MMKIGILMFPVKGSTVDVARFAKRAERLGFESIWAPEHTVIPVNTSEDTLPGYDSIPDPLIALSVASGATTSLKLGTAVCLVPERDPLLLSKQIATLDRQSGGRFLFGIGVGWLREESEIMGVDFRDRWTRTEESVEVMKALWTQDEAEFHGRHFDFPPVICFPKPSQQPHPPVILGSRSRKVFERVVSWCDGWIPNQTPPADIADGRVALNNLSKASGRDPESIEITAGDIPSERGLLSAYEEAGADRVTFRVRMSGDDESISQLEHIASEMLSGTVEEA